jgi:hypothetical protein
VFFDYFGASDGNTGLIPFISSMSEQFPLQPLQAEISEQEMKDRIFLKHNRNDTRIMKRTIPINII